MNCLCIFLALGLITAIGNIALSVIASGWASKYVSSPYTFDDIPSLKGKVAVVTGGNTGIGKVTAKELARKGAHVIITVRSDEKGVSTVKEVMKDVGEKGLVEYCILDLSSLSSVEAFATEFSSKELPLNILINNAGVLVNDYRETSDGIEQHFGVNHLGHFYLVKLLEEQIISSAPSRVVIVSSLAHRFSYSGGINETTLTSLEGMN